MVPVPIPVIVQRNGGRISSLQPPLAIVAAGESVAQRASETVNKGKKEGLGLLIALGPQACETLRLDRYALITHVIILASPPKLRSQSSSFPFGDSPTSRPHSALLLKLPRFAAGGILLAALVLLTVLQRSFQ